MTKPRPAPELKKSFADSLRKNLDALTPPADKKLLEQKVRAAEIVAVVKDELGPLVQAMLALPPSKTLNDRVFTVQAPHEKDDENILFMHFENLDPNDYEHYSLIHSAFWARFDKYDPDTVIVWAQYQGFDGGSPCYTDEWKLPVKDRDIRPLMPEIREKLAEFVVKCDPALAQLLQKKLDKPAKKRNTPKP